MTHYRMTRGLHRAVPISLALATATCNAVPTTADWMLKIGASAEALTASQLDESDVAVMAARLVAANDLLMALETVEAALASAAADASDLALALRDGAFEADLQGDYQQVQTQIAALRQQAADVTDDLFEEACLDLAPAKAQRLTNWRFSAEFAVPAWYRVLDFNAAQWKGVEEAVRAQQRAERLDEDLLPAHASLLQSIESSTDVTSAELQLESQLAAMEALLVSLSSGAAGG